MVFAERPSARHQRRVALSVFGVNVCAVADEENAGAWSTGNFTKILSAITSLSVFDVTADFVKGELMQVLQMPGKHEELCQSMLTVAQELKVEVKRRRQLLSNLMIIKLAPFPKLEEIYMEMGNSRATSGR